MNSWILPGTADIKPLDDLLIRPDGLLRAVPAAKLLEFPLTTLQTWCVKKGVYQYPTEELLNWLATQISGKKAIEICAGNGAIGRLLGITSTDSYMQTKPEIVAYYAALKQIPIKPPADVLKFTANQAVQHYKPEIVIGAWVTQLHKPGDNQGSIEGVDELSIIAVAKYIHLGNDNTHGYKDSMRLPHKHHRFDWLVSRGQDQSRNHAAVWEK